MAYLDTLDAKKAKLAELQEQYDLILTGGRATLVQEGDVRVGYKEANLTALLQRIRQLEAEIAAEEGRSVRGRIPIGFGR